MRRLALLLTAAAFGCTAESTPPPTATRAQAVVNGTREPTVVALTEGQKLAIGYLNLNTQQGGTWCSATVHDGFLVTTAAHCVRDQVLGNLTLGLGPDPETPQAVLFFREVYLHPTLDIAALMLTQNIYDRVAGIEPIPFARSLPAETLGRTVEAGGYGLTNDPTREGRYFVALTVDRVTPETLEVSGDGTRGLCFGDSGASILTNVDGEIVALSVESEGEDSCVGTDQTIRLDTVAAWIDGVRGAACGGVTEAGRCNGQILERCESGRLVTEDCRASNLTCEGGEWAGCVWVEDGGLPRDASADPDDGVPPRDGAVDPDDGVPARDASVDPDDGVPARDASVDPDDGVPARDSGVDPDDGVPAVDPDDGVPPSDASRPQDPDDGVLRQDAGAIRDAGPHSHDTDAAPLLPGPEKVGWGCTVTPQGGSAPLALLGLVGLVALSRRRRP